MRARRGVRRCGDVGLGICGARCMRCPSLRECWGASTRDHEHVHVAPSSVASCSWGSRSASARLERERATLARIGYAIFCCAISIRISAPTQAPASRCASSASRHPLIDVASTSFLHRPSSLPQPRCPACAPASTHVRAPCPASHTLPRRIAPATHRSCDAP